MAIHNCTIQNIDITIRQDANLQKNQYAEDDITALALSNENIVGAKCFLYDNTFVLALLCTPFYLKSERDDFLTNIQSDLSRQINSAVIATLDIDVYRKIKPNMTNEQKESLYRRVIARK